LLIILLAALFPFRWALSDRENDISIIEQSAFCPVPWISDTVRKETDTLRLGKNAHRMEPGDSLGKDGDSLITVVDTLRRPLIDTVGKIPGDSLALKLKDSLKGSLNFPVFSEAKDSIIEDFKDGRRIFYYYGDVKVKYGNFSLDAAYMEYDLDTKTVFASGIKDTAGVLQGRPKMMDGMSEYTMDTVYYNFESRKAKIINMVTQEQEGFLHGTLLKKMPDNSINISKGIYTTCDMEHPHFYLKLSSARSVNDPRITVFGPAYLVIEDVPTPFALPFGFVPNQVTRTSGLLIPSFTEEAARGFGMQGLGYYFVFGDHFDATVTADIFSMGSYNVVVESRYKKRYKYDGTFGFNYSRNQVGDFGTPDYYSSKDFSVKWSHSQDSKARPGTSFRASVNFSTPLNNRFNSYEVQQSLQNQISSSVSYSKTFADSPFSLSANILHSQNSLDSSYAFTLPNFTFTMNTIYPFKSKDAAGKKRFYEEIALSYNASLDNKINFKASEFGGPDFYSKFKSGLRHNFTIKLPSFSLFKYINFSPGVNYGMNWYFQTNEKHYDQETNTVVTEQSNLFSHFGATQEFSGALSMSTRLYGLFNFSSTGRLRKIRHMITPSVSFSFRPELGTPANGYRTLSYVDVNGVQQFVDYNIYEGMIYGYPSKGKSAGLGFSVGNNIEAKVYSDKDTTNGGLKNIPLINSLTIGGSYNFLADSMRLSTISVSMSTNIFGSLGLSANAVLDPYAIDYKGNRIAQFNIVKEGGYKIARLTNASLSLTYQFSGKGERRGGQSEANNKDAGGGGGLGEVTKKERVDYKKVYFHPVTGEYIPGGWLYYLDPSVPWSLNLNYNYSYSKSYQYASEQLKTVHNHMQTLGISAQIRLSRDLNMNMNTGMDLMKLKLTTTQLSATYDLHCFLISFSWIPGGMWESWNFRISAKASALADLLQYKKSSSYWDRNNY
jgi:lipopolysaccharide assembly outer membrane protein LptD (OstA)